MPPLFKNVPSQLPKAKSVLFKSESAGANNSGLFAGGNLDSEGKLLPNMISPTAEKEMIAFSGVVVSEGEVCGVCLEEASLEGVLQ